MPKNPRLVARGDLPGAFDKAMDELVQRAAVAISTIDIIVNALNQDVTNDDRVPDEDNFSVMEENVRRLETLAAAAVAVKKGRLETARTGKPKGEGSKPKPAETPAEPAKGSDESPDEGNKLTIWDALKKGVRTGKKEKSDS